MATTNVSLNPVGWTYTNANIPNTNYANQSPLKAYGSLSDLGECRTILQFDVNSEIGASKINSAVLNLGIKIATGGGIGSDGKLFYSSAFTYGYIYNEVTHNNYSGMLTQGVRTAYTTLSFSSSSFIPNQIDVTSAVANNINDGVLTLVIEGYGAWPLQVDPSSISIVINYEKAAEVDPVVPAIISPNGTYENRSNQIKFEWIYKSQTQAIQASATLEYRKGTSGNYTTINVYSSDNYYTMSANSLNVGIYEWRVRTTDTDGKTSDYAYSAFTVIDRPSVPIITNIENKCISTTIWSSADQVAFEFEVYKDNTLVFSKRVSSSANNYKPNMFFANSTYTIKVRVCNLYGLWSEWGTKIYTFSFSNPPKPCIALATNNTDIIIKSNVVGSILYKSSDNINFIPVYKFDDSMTYIDYNVASDKMYRYFVRSYVDGYSDSDKQIVQVKINGFVLQNDAGYVNVLLSSESFMPYSNTISIDKSINYYSGRNFGVVEFGEHQTRSITRECIVNPQQYDALKDIYLSYKPAIYRDDRGNLFACVVENIPSKNAVLNQKYSVSVTVSQIDYEEEISIYD